MIDKNPYNTPRNLSTEELIEFVKEHDRLQKAAFASGVVFGGLVALLANLLVKIVFWIM